MKKNSSYKKFNGYNEKRKHINLKFTIVVSIHVATIILQKSKSITRRRRVKDIKIIKKKETHTQQHRTTSKRVLPKIIQPPETIKCQTKSKD